MALADILLAIGIACTIGHVVSDALSFRKHARHKRDWATLFGMFMLLGHVVLTGELSSWFERL